MYSNQGSCNGRVNGFSSKGFDDFGSRVLAFRDVGPHALACRV